MNCFISHFHHCKGVKLPFLRQTITIIILELKERKTGENVTRIIHEEMEKGFLRFQFDTKWSMFNINPNPFNQVAVSLCVSGFALIHGKVDRNRVKQLVNRNLGLIYSLCLWNPIPSPSLHSLLTSWLLIWFLAVIAVICYRENILHLNNCPTRNNFQYPAEHCSDCSAAQLLQ